MDPQPGTARVGHRPASGSSSAVQTSWLSSSSISARSSAPRGLCSRRDASSAPFSRAAGRNRTPRNGRRATPAGSRGSGRPPLVFFCFFCKPRPKGPRPAHFRAQGTVLVLRRNASTSPGARAQAWQPHWPDAAEGDSAFWYCGVIRKTIGTVLVGNPPHIRRRKRHKRSDWRGSHQPRRD